LISSHRERDAHRRRPNGEGRRTRRPSPFTLDWPLGAPTSVPRGQLRQGERPTHRLSAVNTAESAGMSLCGCMSQPHRLTDLPTPDGAIMPPRRFVSLPTSVPRAPGPQVARPPPRFGAARTTRPPTAVLSACLAEHTRAGDGLGFEWPIDALLTCRRALAAVPKIESNRDRLPRTE
jgi:hypothetical protein